MNICIIVQKLSFGGGERIIETLTKGFIENGQNLNWIIWSSQIKDEIKSQYPKVKINTINTIPDTIINKIRCIKQIRKLLLENKIDILITFGYAMSLYGVIATLRTKTRTVISERVDPSVWPTVKIHRMLRPIIYSLARGRIFQTQKVLDSYPNFVRNGSIVIQNPIMEEIPAINIENYRKEIVSVGRLSPEKNFKLLIDSFDAIFDQFNHYKLVIYGEGELRKTLEEYIKTKNSHNSITLKGHVQNVTEHLTGADIFVLPSNHEGMPNALIEAMAMGLACISTNFNSGGASEIIKHRENGLLVPVGDKDCMIYSIKSLIDDEVYKQKIKENALLIRLSNNRDTILNKWLNYFEQLM